MRPVKAPKQESEKSVTIKKAQGGFVVNMNTAGDYEGKTAVAHSMTGAMKHARAHLGCDTPKPKKK